MKIKVFVDESGVGGEEHCTVAAYVGKLGQWSVFDQKWRKLLVRSLDSPSYAHLTEMERRTGPFRSWQTGNIADFYRKGVKLIGRHAMFGVSTTVDRKDYQLHYRETIPDRNTPDSVYGVGVRLVLDFIVHHFREFSDVKNPEVDVIFDRGGRTAEALAIFTEMKRGYTDASKILGEASAGKLEDHPGLQITDYMVSKARRAEKEEDVSSIRSEADKQFEGERVRRNPAPFFHITNDQDVLELLLSEKPRMKSRLRYLKNRGH